MNEQRSRFWDELGIISRGWVISAAGFFAVIETVCLFVLPAVAPHDLPSQPWWTLLGLLFAAIVAVLILLFGYVYADAKRRGMNALLWTILVIVTPKPFGFIAYFLLRKPLVRPCPHCRATVGADFVYCPKCGYALLPNCGNCGRAIQRDYLVCPYCGKPAAQTPATPLIDPVG